MTLATDTGDVRHSGEYVDTMMGESVEPQLSDIGMIYQPFTQRHHGIDDLPPAVIDSIILNLLEDFARRNCDPGARLWSTGLAG